MIVSYAAMPRDVLDAVKQLLHTENQTTVNLVGPEIFSFGELFDIISANKKNALKLIEISRSVMDFLVLRIAAKVIPTLITSQQYRLLFTDNVADPSPLCKLLGRPLQSAVNFFRRSLVINVSQGNAFCNPAQNI